MKNNAERKLDFEPEEEPKEVPLVQQEHWIRMKEKVEADQAIAQGQHSVFKKTYPRLTDKEIDKLIKMDTPGERRAYIIKRYSIKSSKNQLE